MRLLSATVRSYRVHRDFALDFHPSLNVLAGPNESGKSTLAEALHRALFLRGKIGGDLQKGMLSHNHPGTPEVTLSFQADGKTWTVRKQFAGARGSTLLSSDDGVSLRDAEAEEKLDALMGCETAFGPGAAGKLPKLWAHLWVWQGSSGADPADIANDHRASLTSFLQQEGAAALLQSATDQRVASAIQQKHGCFFTQNGREKSGSTLHSARAHQAECAAALDSARANAVKLAQAAETHSRAEKELAEISATQPKIESDLTAIRKKLDEAEQLRRAVDVHQQAAATASGQLAELETQDRNIRQLQQDHASQTAAIRPAEAKLATLSQSEDSARTASQAADAGHRQAAEALHQARLAHDIANAALALLEKQEIHADLASRAADASKIQAELAALRSDLAALPALTPDTLERLRKLETDVTKAESALQAMATGVELIAAPGAVLLNGEALSPADPRILTEPAEITTADGLQLRIQPGGGTSLTSARDRQDQARGSLADALRNHALRDLAHAAEVMEKRRTLSQQSENLNARWQALGGKKLTARLEAAISELEAARGELSRRSELAGRSATTPDSRQHAQTQARQSLAALNDAERAEAAARAHAERARSSLENAAKARTRQFEQNTAAQQAIRDLHTRITTLEETHGAETQRQERISAAREAENKAKSELERAREALGKLQPELLEADLSRLQRSLHNLEENKREAENARLLARHELILDGSSDPEAELRLAEVRHANAVEQTQAEECRAQAIGKLHELFTNARTAIDRALAKPLAERISGYLACVFGPGAEADFHIGENGMQDLKLSRPGLPQCPFSALSGGAREQSAAAVRLALAEILAAEHDGCLPLLFDDAFAYSDPERIGSLQRMLDLAAGRGLQIIVLTCSPADYTTLGARQIKLPAPDGGPAFPQP